MIVEENGKLFNIDDDTGLVTEAGFSEAEALEDEYRLGDRVEVVGHVGEVISVVPSYYGVAFGVRFDDGQVDEFAESQLKHSSVEKLEYASPFEEVFVRFAAYHELPQYTNDEINRKSEEAQWLRLRAKALAADSKLELSDQNQLGRVILITESDLNDFKDLLENSEESQAYTSRLTGFKIADEFHGYGAGLGMKGDASWLQDALEDMEVVETTDEDLAARATEVVASLSKEQLEDDNFMDIVSSYQHKYLQMTDDQVKKFHNFLINARHERVKELPKLNTASKVASNLDDATDIFL